MNGLVLFGASDVLQQTTFFCEQQPDAEECAQLASDAISSLLVGAGISALSLSNPLWYKAAVWLAETLSVGAADLYIAYAASVTGAAAYTLGASSLFAVPPATAAGLAVGAVAVVIPFPCLGVEHSGRAAHSWSRTACLRISARRR